jgi:hypothetical protein
VVCTGDIEGELELLGGTRFIRINERLLQLWEQPTDNSVLYASEDGKWYRWKPSEKDNQKLQAQRVEAKMAEEYLMIQHNLASMTSSQSSASDSLASISSTSAGSSSAWTQAKALDWLKNLNPSATNLSSIDNLERTPLHLASSKGPADLVEFLVSLLDVADAKDRVGKTALHYACESGRAANVRILLRHWSQQEGGFKWFDARDKNRTTPLMLAARAGHQAIISLLLHPLGSQHIDLLLKDMDGKNALHWAAEGGHLDCVEALLAQDTQNQLCLEKDARGRTPADLATNKSVKKRLIKQAEKNDPLGPSSATAILALTAFAFIIVGLALGIWVSGDI